jgi:NitT/TauT family transport system substrate-binding protein
MARHSLVRSFTGVAVLALLATACGNGGSSTEPAGTDATSTDDVGDAEAAGAELEGEFRLGYFPNVTHAPAIVGVQDGHFEEALGDGVELTPQTFNAGPDVITALLSGALDASYIGPNPAINGYAQSGGEALRIVGGTTSGGAFLVTRPDITTPEDLAGATLSTPQLGNTQDVALRAWLSEEGYETTLEGGGEVNIQPQENAQILQTFTAGEIDGAWVPEPWATRLIEEGGGEILVDERDLWEGGEYVTTHLIVATQTLEERPEFVRALLEGHLAALDAVAADPDGAQETVSASIEAITGSPIAPEVLAASWENLTFTPDPIAGSLFGSAQDAEEAGLLEPVDLDGIYALDLLNELLAERGEEEVAGS